MKRIALFFILTASIVLTGQKNFAQKGKLDSLFAKADTTVVMDSLMNGFEAYLDSLSQPKSFFSVSTGIGNRTFSIRNNSLNTQESKTNMLSVTPTFGYYHKSGLGISITGFLSTLHKKLDCYQYAITPSYDYIGKKISFGISYTRNLGKDTAILNSSPYENDLYGYFIIRHHSWRYGVSAGYASGNFSDKLTYRDSLLRYNTSLQKFEWFYYRKTISSTNKIKDISFSASARKDFEWYKVFVKNDNLVLSISSYIVAGVTRMVTVTNTSAKKGNISLARFRRTYEDTSGNGLQFQSAAISASLFYTLGDFNFQPIWFIDYYFPDSDRKINQVFSFTVGYSF